VVEPGVYNGDLDLGGREDIVLTSLNPDDPVIVAETIIDCQSSGRAFTFVHGEDANTVIDGFAIVNGRVSGQGGAIYVGSGANPTLTNLQISKCFATGLGGAIYIAPGANMNIVDVDISGCTAGGDGGAIYVGDGSNVMFAECDITKCSTWSGSGGAIYCASSGTFVVDECMFSENTASNAGGAIGYGDNTTATIYNCKFSNNNSHSGGAVFYGSDSVVVIKECELRANMATYDGGAIYYDHGAVSQMSHTIFRDNTAIADGGAVLYRSDSIVSIVDCNFEDNSATSGAGLYFDLACAGTLTGNLMVSNKASDAGGAVYLVGSGPLAVADCNISNNTAHHGGGLYCLYSPQATITDCIIVGNQAAGVITTVEYFEPDPNDPNVPLDPEKPLDQSDPNFDPSDPNLIRQEFETPTAIAQGGGIYSWAGPKSILRCNISNNEAKSSGGGIYLGGDDDPNLVVPQEIRDCLITANKAGRDGGGISCNWYADLTVAGCTIADNKVARIPSYGGGLYCSYGSKADVIDSIIWGNVGNTGSQIAVGTGDPGYPIPSKLKVSYSDIQVFQEEPNDGAVGQLKVVDPSLLGPNTPDYFIYSVLNVGDFVNDVGFGVFGAGSWVDEEGVNHIIGVSGNTAYIFTVSIPEGTDPQDHPKNPYSPGEIAERTFELERIFELGDEYMFGHSNEFYVDPEENAIYIGANYNGILKYVFDSDANNPVEDGPSGNYVFDSKVAPPVPIRTESLAYDPATDTWYAGVRYIYGLGSVLKYDGSQGPNGKWEVAFTYTPMRGGAHHDGMEFVNGHLFLSDMYGDWILQFTPDGTLVNTFYHEPLGRDLEGLGFGAFRHFWSSSFTGQITEFGGGMLQYGIDVVPPTPPIAVEQGSVLVGWAPEDENDFMTWDVNAWDPNLHNIDSDPCFIHGYYLSHIDASQQVDSPCIDAGSDLASNLGQDAYTTRTDGEKDSGVVDMGYHYAKGIPQYELTVTVEGGHGTVEPNSGSYNEGDMVKLTARPDPNYYVKGWYDDANGVLLGIEKTLEVVMNADRSITVKFKQPRMVEVSGGGGALRDAVDAAENGDILVVAAGTYEGDIDLQGKEIKLFGTNPDDPCVVGRTIIDGDGENRGFIIDTGEDANTVIDGFVIINANADGQSGGGIYIGTGCSPVIANVTIKDSGADVVRGGGIYVGPESSPTFRNVTINNCSASSAGGGVYVSMSSQPVFSYCTISNCSAAEGSGGGIYFNRAVQTILERTVLSDNVALSGGGIYFNANCTSTLTGCSFNGNSADYGAGIYFYVNNDTNIDDCNFVGNTASADGGGVLCDRDSSIIVTGCTFTGNQAISGAGLFFDPNCQGKVVASTLTSNTASENGGGIRMIDCNNMLIADSNISGNIAARGGGIFALDSPEALIDHCVINNNEAVRVELTYDYFLPDPNWTPPADDPNAEPPLISISPDDPNFDEDDPNLVIEEHRDETGIAQGGGIFAFRAFSSVIDSDISYNIARTSGGGLYIGGDFYWDTVEGPKLKNCLITNNKAGRDGGGISANWYVEAQISNCTIADNEATGIFGFSYGGGLYASYSSSVDVINSIIWGNASGYKGSQIAVGSGDLPYPLPSVVNITYSAIEPEPEPGEEQEITGLDIVFCIDTTGSMGGDIDAVKAAATEIVRAIATRVPDYRIAAVTYEDYGVDYNTPDDHAYEDEFGFESDLTAIVDGLNAIELGFGGDGPETPYAAIMHVLDPCDVVARLDDPNLRDPNSTGIGLWRTGTQISRAIIVMGDAPPKDPEPHSEYTLDDVVAAATSGPAPVRIFTIPVRGWAETKEYFAALAERTGGAMLEAASSEEVVDAIMTAIGILTQRAPMINVDSGCRLSGWIPDTNSWDPNSHNMIDDPCFVNANEEPNLVVAYYLSNSQADQTIDSPYIDAGSAAVTDASVGLDPNRHTTRTDGVGDTGIVDLGYHYLIEDMSELTIKIVDANGIELDPGEAHGYVEPAGRLYPKGRIVELVAHPDQGYQVARWTGTDNDQSVDVNNIVTMNDDKVVTVQFERAPIYSLSVIVPGGHGKYTVSPASLDPNVLKYYDRTVVKLTAVPDPNYRVSSWTGTDDDSSTQLTNTVTMNEDKVVIVQFELPEIIRVSSEPNGIIDAIEQARDGDTLVVGAGTYNGGINPKGKAITITSTNPDDPNVVAATIIDCIQGGRGFIFNSGEGPNTIIDGLTIVNASVSGTGGAGIYVDSGSSPTIRNVVIRNCSAVTDANGIGRGAGIYVDTNSSPEFINCTVVDCNAEQGAGAYCNAGSSALFRHCTFRSNTAVLGGGIYFRGVDRLTEVSDCNISDNTAEYGAGMYVGADSSAAIVGTLLLRNDANEAGGSVYMTNADEFSVVDCNIERNIARLGAGLYVYESNDILITACQVKYNKAPALIDPNDPNDPNAGIVGQGGGIYCWGTNATISDCVIAYNAATTSGGGLYLVKDPNSPQIINCLIINNLAGRDGGGISANWYCRPFIANCTIAGNAAVGVFGTEGYSGFGGGIYAGYHSDVNVIDSILWINYALDGSQIAVAAGFEFGDPWPSVLTISYSDIMDGLSAVRVEPGCKLIGEVGNIASDPLFVTGPLGDYYLSQTASRESVDSPCVNAGSKDASAVGMTSYTTRTDEVFDTGKVDMGYHYPLSKKAEPCKLCDLVFDGQINFYDYAAFALAWLQEGCSESGGWCNGSDLTFDSRVDYKDLAFFADCWLVADIVAPVPNPAQWRVEPYSVSTTPPYSISMTAETAYDAWGWQPLYYFECVSDSNYNSDWQSSPTYEVGGLNLGDELCFRVKAMDGAGNETGWSSEKCALVSSLGPEEDFTPPAPAPAIDVIEANSPNSITMVATTAYDVSGVEYYFECYSGDCHDSGWQDEPNYTDVNLTAETEYCYRVRARDKSPNHNTTVWSEVSCVTTPAMPDKEPPTPDPMQWDRSLDANGIDGRPHEYYGGGGIFDYYVTMRADPNTDDPSGFEFYFECIDDHNYDSGWMYFPGGPPYVYTFKIGQSGFTYRFRVKARDRSPNHNETAWSEPEPIRR